MYTVSACKSNLIPITDSGALSQEGVVWKVWPPVCVLGVRRADFLSTRTGRECTEEHTHVLACTCNLCVK